MQIMRVKSADHINFLPQIFITSYITMYKLPIKNIKRPILTNSHKFVTPMKMLLYGSLGRGGDVGSRYASGMEWPPWVRPKTNRLNVQNSLDTQAYKDMGTKQVTTCT